MEKWNIQKSYIANSSCEWGGQYLHFLQDVGSVLQLALALADLRQRHGQTRTLILNVNLTIINTRRVQ